MRLSIRSSWQTNLNSTAPTAPATNSGPTWCCSLDSINSHVAARLARALDNWRRYTPELARLMHAALTKVARTENLSAGVSEVVEKALNTY